MNAMAVKVEQTGCVSYHNGADHFMTATQSALLMLHFVFVHGFGGGGWSFYKIRSLLEKCGYKVSCPDLKSGGIDPTDPKTIHTFEDYDYPLIQFLSSLPHNEKVILVGHSAGGVSLTHAIHKLPHKIHVAVFVSATMLRSGFLTDQDLRDGIPAPHMNTNRPESDISNASHPVEQHVREPQSNKRIRTCPPEDATLASMLRKDGPFQAIRAARFTKNNREVDKIPRVYIKGLYDRVLTPKQQESMVKRWPPSKVYSVDSDHAVFCAVPLEVFQILMKIAANLHCYSGAGTVPLCSLT